MKKKTRRKEDKSPLYSYTTNLQTPLISAQNTFSTQQTLKVITHFAFFSCCLSPLSLSGKYHTFMGSSYEPETEPNTTPPKLQLTSLPYLKSTQLSGTLLTPLTPLHTSASVPFSWEQEPGKPLPCLALALPSSNANNVIKCLELPPRLLNETKFTKTPSPTTVLEGPYDTLGRSLLGSSSFRFLKKRQKSFDGAISLAGSSPETGLLSSMVVGDKKDRGLFSSWRKRGGCGVGFKSKSEAHGGSFVFPSSSDDNCDSGEAVKVTRVSSKRSQLSLSQNKSHFWATVYGAFKQVIPRRSSSKWKRDGL